MDYGKLSDILELLGFLLIVYAACFAGIAAFGLAIGLVIGGLGLLGISWLADLTNHKKGG